MLDKYLAFSVILLHMMVSFMDDNKPAIEQPIHSCIVVFLALTSFVLSVWVLCS